MRHLIRVSTPLAIALGLILVTLLVLARPMYATSSLHVNTLVDKDDGDCGGSGNPGTGGGDCSLREAIAYAKSNSGADDITFDLGGVITITLGDLTIYDISGKADNTTIDGDLDNDGMPEVEVRYDSGTVNSNLGLINVMASGCRIEGLAVTNSPQNGICVAGDSVLADNNLIINNWVGIDLSGAVRGNAKNGIRIYYNKAAAFSSASGNIVQHNLASGNGSRGISVQDASDTQILSNTVGLDATGTIARANAGSGVYLSGALTTTVQGNLVSGNGLYGISITGTRQTTIVNNIVGLNAAGNASLGNQSTAGIYVDANSVTTTIRGNTVSGNQYNGISLLGGATGVVIAGNKIGTNITGTAGLGNGRITNRDGIQILDAYGITIGGPDLADRNIIADNGRAGILISGTLAVSNVIWNNYIGTDVSGALDLGNGDTGSTSDSGHGGLYLANGTSYNLIQDNLIGYNYIGLRFDGGSAAQLVPPQYNQALTNTLIYNNKYGIANQTTHRNAVYATAADGDNLIQGNVISATGQRCAPSANWCEGVGIFNVGASPRVVGNTLYANKSSAIANVVHFGVDGPDNAADDLLSMPYIAGNSISYCGNDTIVSRDTAPLNKTTLLGDNTFGYNGINPYITQRWFVAVEVVSGTQTLNSGLTVTITRQSGERACENAHCVGSSFASDGGSGGIWGPTGVSYTDVQVYTGTTWFEVIEYKATSSGMVTYTPHLVRVGGAQLGSRYFAFDGITTTEEVSGEVNLPFCRPTGILSDSTQSLCRYQIGQVPVFASFSSGDFDGDGIPDSIEGTGDTDGDGIPDFQDTDSDNDGIPDNSERVCTPGVGSGDPCDSDGDSIPDFQDGDSDNDGIPDLIEGNADTDGDTIPDYRDTDSDGDGIPDAEEWTCEVGTGLVCDADGDGIPDYREADSDNDGILDSVEGAGDADSDGIPNYRDTDADGNGILDQNETDPFGDLDHDGILNFLDTDDDGDGISDADEYSTGPSDPLIGCTAGTPICFDNDADGDGIPNYRDPDSDGDGTPDSQESKTNPEPPPFGHPGVPAWLDPVYRLRLPIVTKS